MLSKVKTNNSLQTLNDSVIKLLLFFYKLAYKMSNIENSKAKPNSVHVVQILFPSQFESTFYDDFFKLIESSWTT